MARNESVVSMGVTIFSVESFLFKTKNKQRFVPYLDNMAFSAWRRLAFQPTALRSTVLQPLPCRPMVHQQWRFAVRSCQSMSMGFLTTFFWGGGV